MWEDGWIGLYFYETKVYDEPSMFGIDRGRISKLTVYDSDKNICCNYDRGWDVYPDNDEVKEVVQKIMNMYN